MNKLPQTGPETTLMFSMAYDAKRDKWILAGYDKAKGGTHLEYGIVGEGNYEGMVQFLDKAWGSDFLHQLLADLRHRFGGESDIAAEEETNHADQGGDGDA